MVTKTASKRFMVRPPSHITSRVFHAWRDARRSEVEAEDLSNPYWSWLIRSEVSAWAANEWFGGPSSFGGRPAWSPQRFGQSTTALPDGRTVMVAGEHEDYYDPDFFIYNDVFVVAPSGEITILGYPEDIFPPTDFHSATLREGELLLIGNLGYTHQRIEGVTQILRLELEDWTVRVQGSLGEGPGWIHRHEATLSEDQQSIVVTRGLVHHTDNNRLIENFDDWRLHLEGWQWERLTTRNWTVLEMERTDGKRNELWEMRQAIWNSENDFESAVEYPMPRDREALEALYYPEAVSHRDRTTNDDDYNVTRIEVDGVILRFVEDSHHVTMTVEGELPDATLRALVDDVLKKLRMVTGAEYTVTRLRG